MKLSELKAKGGFVPSELVAKDVTWKRGDEELAFTIYVKRQSFGAMEKLFSGDSDQSKSAKFISECIFLGENGKERISYEDAYQLDPGLAAVFAQAVNEVNGAKPKN